MVKLPAVTLTCPEAMVKVVDVGAGEDAAALNEAKTLVFGLDELYPIDVVAFVWMADTMS